MTLPDRIFTIGGAGKDIGMELLESEWVLREVLRPRRDPKQLTVTFLDTAEEERNDDLDRIEAIRERRDELKAELRDSDSGRVGDVDIRYKLITENIMLNSRIDLTGEDVVPRIVAGNGIERENWWLEEDHIEENLNFAKGAVRKRGLGKAMYYKAYAEDDELATLIDLPSKGEVAVIGGLGGGTGSGLFVDVATELAQKMPTADITLFGVLPNHTEGLRESANAFAALSEFERLSLEGEQLFKDRILMPIDPTGFDGKRGNRVESDEMLERFDEAAVYLIAGYYNTQGMEDVFDGSPQFAPFTIGIPQILRYNIDAVQEARGTFQEILDTKETAMDAEEEIYEEVGLFLDTQFDDVEGGLRGEDENDLAERLQTFESLLESELFDELEYRSVDIFREIVSDAKNEAEDVGDRIDVIGGSLRAGVAEPNQQVTFKDSVDARLVKVLSRELELLVRRKRLLESKTAIETSRIQRTVEYLLGTEDVGTSAGGIIQRLQSQLDDSVEKLERLEDDLAETEAELERQREDQDEEIEASIATWERAVEDDLEQLETVDVAAVESDLATLHSALSGYMSEVVNAETEEEVDGVGRGDVNQAINQVEGTLQPMGVHFDDDKRAINQSLSELRDAKKAFLTMQQEESTFESLTPWESSTAEAKQDAQKTFRMAGNRLDDAGVYAVGPPDEFRADIEYDVDAVVRRVRQRADDLEAAVVRALREELDESPNESDVTELESVLEPGDVDRETCRDVVRRAFERELVETDDLEARQENLESRIEELSTDIELFEATIDLFEAVNAHRRTFEQNDTEFRESLVAFDDDASGSVAVESEDYVFIKNIQPDDVLQATGNETLAETDLFADPHERNRMRESLEELAKNTLDRKYTGLQRRKLSHRGRRYSDLRVRVALMSPAIEHIDGETVDLKSTYREAFDLEGNPTKQRYSAWSPPIGGDWDIGLGVFIDGVFLDNIRKVVQADGYASGYQEWAGNADVDIRIHHSLGLDEGYYVRRTDTLNVESTDDVEFLLQDESAVVNGLLDQYSERVSYRDDETTTDETTTDETTTEPEQSVDRADGDPSTDG
jgi:tetratricopeptide (TPR) repeat protein